MEKRNLSSLRKRQMVGSEPWVAIYAAATTKGLENHSAICLEFVVAAAMLELLSDGST